jgi:hypothetical protein
MMDVLAAKVAGDSATCPSHSPACQVIRISMPNGTRYNILAAKLGMKNNKLSQANIRNGIVAQVMRCRRM